MDEKKEHTSRRRLVLILTLGTFLAIMVVIVVLVPTLEQSGIQPGTLQSVCFSYEGTLYEAHLNKRENPDLSFYPIEFFDQHPEGWVDEKNGIYWTVDENRKQFVGWEIPVTEPAFPCAVRQGVISGHRPTAMVRWYTCNPSEAEKLFYESMKTANGFAAHSFMYNVGPR